MHPIRLCCENAISSQYALHFHALSAGRLSCQIRVLIFVRTLAPPGKQPFFNKEGPIMATSTAPLSEQDKERYNRITKENIEIHHGA